jgi:hypothetical protein
LSSSNGNVFVTFKEIPHMASSICDVFQIPNTGPLGTAIWRDLVESRPIFWIPQQLSAKRISKWNLVDGKERRPGF